jgi:D-glycero-D-manno-heptose 1,7-bisphosphate phosphatase
MAVPGKLIILDRDGVINQDSDDYIKSLDEWIPIPGSIDAIARLSQAGFTIAVATNQSGIGRGLFDLDELEKMHNKLNSLVNDAGGAIAGIFYCPHRPEDQCSCRKPKSGLLNAIEHELEINVAGAWLVGDSLRDLQAGAEKNCVPVLVKTGKGENTLDKINREKQAFLEELLIFDNLDQFSRYLVEDGSYK